MDSYSPYDSEEQETPWHWDDYVNRFLHDLGYTPSAQPTSDEAGGGVRA